MKNYNIFDTEIFFYKIKLNNDLYNQTIIILVEEMNNSKVINNSC